MAVAEKHKFVPGRHLLSMEYQSTLSEHACSLYATIWNRMASRSATQVSMKDLEAAQRSQFQLEDVQAAQAELVRADLLHIMPAIVLNTYPGLPKSIYEFLDDEAA